MLLAGLSMLCSFKSHCRKSRNRHDERDLKFRTPVTHLLMVCSEQQEGATVPPTHSPPGPASPELAAALWLRWRRSLGRAFPYSAFAAIWDHASWMLLMPTWSLFCSMAITKKLSTMSDCLFSSDRDQLFQVLKAQFSINMGSFGQET